MVSYDHTHNYIFKYTKELSLKISSSSLAYLCIVFICSSCILFLGQVTALIPATETTPEIPGESIFTYEPGESQASFSMPDHVPPFMDEILPSLLENATLVEVCGNNVECLFDFSQTGDAEFAMATVAVENEAIIASLSACK